MRELDLLLSSSIDGLIDSPLNSSKLSFLSDTTESSSWWDPYHERSSYEISDSGFWFERDNKIPIVSTEISDLSSVSSLECLDQEDTFVSSRMAPSEACNNACKELVRANNVLQARVYMLDGADIDSSYVHSIPAELDSIRDLLTDYIVKVNEFLFNIKEEIDSSTVTSWKEEISKAKALVVNHKKTIWARYNELNPVKPLSYYEEQSLSNQTKQITLQESRNQGTVGLEEKRIVGIAQVKYDALVKASSSILKITSDRSADTLSLADDDDIRKYIR